MNKELKEILKELEELNETIEDLLKDNDKDFNSKLQKGIDKAMKDKASISIEKFENGTAEVNFEGRNLAVLITLAGLENCVLEKLNPPKELWEIIKHRVGTMEVNDNE